MPAATVTNQANAMRARSGIRSQLSSVPHRPTGPAGLSLAGTALLPADNAFFETKKATKGRKEAVVRILRQA